MHGRFITFTLGSRRQRVVVLGSHTNCGGQEANVRHFFPPIPGFYLIDAALSTFDSPISKRSSGSLISTADHRGPSSCAVSQTQHRLAGTLLISPFFNPPPSVSTVLCARISAAYTLCLLLPFSSVGDGLLAKLGGPKVLGNRSVAKGCRLGGT